MADLWWLMFYKASSFVTWWYIFVSMFFSLQQRQQPCSLNTQRPWCGGCRRGLSRECWTLIMSVPEMIHRFQRWSTRSRAFLIRSSLLCCAECKCFTCGTSQRVRASWKFALLASSFSGDHKQKFYWGHKEILIPVYKNMSDAMKKHPDVDVLISFASLRSAFESTMETMQYPQVSSCIIWIKLFYRLM